MDQKVKELLHERRHGPFISAEEMFKRIEKMMKKKRKEKMGGKK